MNPTQKEKIQRFLADKVMAKSVFDVLLTEFLKPAPMADVNLLAASRVAIDLLQEGWKELEKCAVKEDPSTEIRQQVGV